MPGSGIRGLTHLFAMPAGMVIIIFLTCTCYSLVKLMFHLLENVLLQHKQEGLPLKVPGLLPLSTGKPALSSAWV